MEVMAQNRQSLEQLEGIGRGEMIAKDPLGFSGVILKKMSALLPANKAQSYQEQLISEDGWHALIIARLKYSGTDTAVAVKIQNLIDDCQKELKAQNSSDNQFTLTPVGAYRVALDNGNHCQTRYGAGYIINDAGHSHSFNFYISPSAHRIAGASAFDGGNHSRLICLFFFV